MVCNRGDVGSHTMGRHCEPVSSHVPWHWWEARRHCRVGAGSCFTVATAAGRVVTRSMAIGRRKEDGRIVCAGTSSLGGSAGNGALVSAHPPFKCLKLHIGVAIRMDMSEDVGVGNTGLMACTGVVDGVGITVPVVLSGHVDNNNRQYPITRGRLWFWILLLAWFLDWICFVVGWECGWSGRRKQWKDTYNHQRVNIKGFNGVSVMKGNTLCW